MVFRQLPRPLKNQLHLGGGGDREIPRIGGFKLEIQNIDPKTAMTIKIFKNILAKEAVFHDLRLWIPSPPSVLSIVALVQDTSGMPLPLPPLNKKIS